MVDPWSILLFAIYTVASGPSPLVLPFAAFCVFGEHAVLWRQVTDAFPGWTLPVIFLPTVSIVVFWVNGFLLLLIDSYWRPQVILQYKIQKDQRFDLAKVGKVARNLLFNQFLIIYPFAAFCHWLKWTTDVGPYTSEILPSHKEMVLHTVAFIVVDEVLFYYGHRALHHKSVYGKYHKMHHEFTSPIGLTAIYCHPFEMLVSNVIPLFGGCIPLSSHMYSVLGWIVFGVLGTQTHHCGYHWPWMFFDHQPSFHDFHHEKFNCNYGNLTWLDRLHGTDKMYREHESAKAAKAA